MLEAAQYTSPQPCIWSTTDARVQTHGTDAFTKTLSKLTFPEYKHTEKYSNQKSLTSSTRACNVSQECKRSKRSSAIGTSTIIARYCSALLSLTMPPLLLLAQPSLQRILAPFAPFTVRVPPSLGLEPTLAIWSPASLLASPQSHSAFCDL